MAISEFQIFHVTPALLPSKAQINGMGESLRETPFSLGEGVGQATLYWS